MNIKSTDLSKIPGAFLAKKRPIPVYVEFANCSGVLATLEGDVSYEVGDAIITGVAGEHWPVSRDRFVQSYDPQGETRSGEVGSYVKRPMQVWVWRTPTRAKISLQEEKGKLLAEPGDFIVQYSVGDWAVIGASIFNESYELI